MSQPTLRSRRPHHRKLTIKCCWVGSSVWLGGSSLTVSQTPRQEVGILREASPPPRRSVLPLVLAPVAEPNSENVVASTDARPSVCAHPILSPIVPWEISESAY